LAAVFLGGLAACGGYVSRTTVTPSGPGADVPPVVTLTREGASPRELHIFARDVATFVNRDDRPHEMRSDARLNNDSRCGSVSVGLLMPGESRKAELQPSGIVCFYRDERDPTNPALQGYVLVHY